MTRFRWEWTEVGPDGKVRSQTTVEGVTSDPMRLRFADRIALVLRKDGSVETWGVDGRISHWVPDVFERIFALRKERDMIQAIKIFDLVEAFNLRLD